MGYPQKQIEASSHDAATPDTSNMDLDKLIALVRDQSVLWDKGDENYKSRMEKEKVWLIVLLRDGRKFFSITCGRKK